MSRAPVCRICDGTVQEFFDLGYGPLANAFLVPGQRDGYRFHLAIGACQSHTWQTLGQLYSSYATPAAPHKNRADVFTLPGMAPRFCVA